MFGHLLLNLGGGIDIHAIWKGVSGQARVHGGGGARGRCKICLLEIGKIDAVRGNFNLFHLCFTYEIRGNRYTVQAKWKGGRTDACPL